MTWSPANTTVSCAENPSSAICQPSVLTFLTFLVKYLGFSHDEKFSDFGKDKLNTTDEFDFIIVGAGSAGCVVANRLSEITNWKVLLLEGGDEEPVITDIPAMSVRMSKSSIDYGYLTQPENTMCDANKNKSFYWLSGNVMGGTSSINGMLYMRGNKQDYDDWENLGNPGWSWKDVLPYFLKSEDARDPDVYLENRHLHAKGGYLNVGRLPYKDENTDAILNTWKELGLQETDYNSGDQIGVSRAQYTNVHGVHLSSNGAFIRPIRGRRPNLTVRSNSRVTKIIIDEQTKRAIGVEYFTSQNTVKRSFAKKEVIVSAGAIASPKLLMLSGIGPRDNLQEANVKVIKESPVGKTLHNHIEISAVKFKLNNKAKKSTTLENIQNDIVYWLSTHEGPVSANGIFDIVAFHQTSYDTRRGIPDLQISFPTAKYNEFKDVPLIPTAYYDEINMQLTLLKPNGHGTLKLNKVDPVWGQPVINTNYTTVSKDLKALAEGMKVARQFAKVEYLKTNGIEESKVPLKECQNFEYDSEEYIECAVKCGVNISNHPSGTCKMGSKSDPFAVVDSRLRVYGIKSLRVIDASIMPEIPRGSLNAPCIMIGEKGSHMIKEDWL